MWLNNILVTVNLSIIGSEGNLVGSTMTDSLGYYKIDGIPNGEYTIDFSKRGMHFAIIYSDDHFDNKPPPFRIVVKNNDLILEEVIEVVSINYYASGRVMLDDSHGIRLVQVYIPQFDRSNGTDLSGFYAIQVMQHSGYIITDSLSFHFSKEGYVFEPDSIIVEYDGYSYYEFPDVIGRKAEP